MSKCKFVEKLRRFQNTFFFFQVWIETIHALKQTKLANKINSRQSYLNTTLLHCVQWVPKRIKRSVHHSQAVTAPVLVKIIRNRTVDAKRFYGAMTG